MIVELAYKGILVNGTGIAGERKCDGIIPAHPGILRVSRDRWMLFIATLDSNGWDATKSILYQLRADAPDGPIVREGLIAPSVEDWDPLSRGDRFSKRCGMGVGFGVPKGAVAKGRLLGNHNVFAVKWYRYAHLRLNGEMLNPLAWNSRDKWPQREEIGRKTLRLEWMQFKLNEAENDIEILQPPALLTQRGYSSAEEFCSLGTGFSMNHAMTPPVPADDECREWVEFDSFGRGVAPVRYRFKENRGLYEWVETGGIFSLPETGVGESSTIRYKGDWIIALRTSYPDGRTCWLRTNDPFGALGKHVFSPPDAGPRESPRHVYLYADGVIRMLGNECSYKNIGGGIRNPLYLFDIDPETFDFKQKQVVLDAKAAGLPFPYPFCDHSKLCPNQGRRQLIVIRCITGRQTGPVGPNQPVTPEEHARAGIHLAEIMYGDQVPDTWTF